MSEITNNSPPPASVQSSDSTGRSQYCQDCQDWLFNMLVIKIIFLLQPVNFSFMLFKTKISFQTTIYTMLFNYIFLSHCNCNQRRHFHPFASSIVTTGLLPGITSSDFLKEFPRRTCINDPLFTFEYKDLRYPSHKTSNEDTNYQIQIWPNIYLYHPGMFVLNRQTEIRSSRNRRYYDQQKLNRRPQLTPNKRDSISIETQLLPCS